MQDLVAYPDSFSEQDFAIFTATVVRSSAGATKPVVSNFWETRSWDRSRSVCCVTDARFEPFALLDSLVFV